MKEHHNFESELLITKYLNLFESRYSNGGIKLIKFQFANNELEKLFSNNMNALHGREGFNIISKSKFIKDKLFDNGISVLDFNELKIQDGVLFQAGLLKFIGHLANKLFIGGTYFHWENKENELNSRLALTLTHDFIMQICDELHWKYVVYLSEGINWNNWFKADWCSASYYLVPKHMKSLILIMIRDEE